VRGSAAIGQPVFVRDGVVEALAPNLSIEVIEVCIQATSETALLAAPLDLRGRQLRVADRVLV
jgi:hypothetical protein